MAVSGLRMAPSHCLSPLKQKNEKLIMGSALPCA